jgi:hypothetical protein
VRRLLHWGHRLAVLPRHPLDHHLHLHLRVTNRRPERENILYL